MADSTGTHYVISRWNDKGRSYYSTSRNWTQDHTQAKRYEHADMAELTAKCLGFGAAVLLSIGDCKGSILDRG